MVIVLIAVVLFTVLGVFIKRRYNTRERERQDLKDQLQNMKLNAPAVIDGDKATMSECNEVRCRAGGTKFQVVRLDVT